MMFPLIDRVGPFDAVVLANGDFPTAEIPLRILHEAQHVVACDGAAAYLTSGQLPVAFPLLLEGGVSEGRGGRDRVIIIGDGDSVPDNLRHRLLRIDEQDDNDLTKATRYCLQQDWHQIAYLGATGKREDHTLGNISLLMRYYRDLGVEGTIFTDYGYFTPARTSRTFDSIPGQQVSIFNFGCTRIHSEGLKWQSYAYQEWWQGTLNEAIGTTFSIAADGYYLVYRTYDPKVSDSPSTLSSLSSDL